MALDEALAVSSRSGASPPTLRLYGWQQKAVSLGCFQKTTDIDLEFCHAENIAVVRRPTGGRAILHGCEMTYSVSAQNEGAFSHGLFHTYHFIGIALKGAIEAMGGAVSLKMEKAPERRLVKSPVCFESTSYGEISGLDGRKLAGSAQQRKRDGFLQQGSIPYVMDHEKTGRVFGRDAAGLRLEMMGLKETCPGLDHEAFKQALCKAFENTFDCRLVLSGPTPAELELASQLVEEKYGDREWNISGRNLTEPEGRVSRL
jgi:lipoate-protein ligase A